MAEQPAQLGIIGGSGLYAMPELEVRESVAVETPFGVPSDAISLGRLGRMPVAFLARHGQGHHLNPSAVPARANIYALKQLGVRWILSVSAVGSLRDAIAPLDIVVPDQLFDRTIARPSTFFDEGIVAHVSFADPFCPQLSARVFEAATAQGGVRAHRGGTYVCIEGPLFSTRAESRVYRQLGFDVIGMTALPEAKLAREAELCYASIACVTDYDVWRTSEEAVSVELVVANLQRNVAVAQRILRAVAERLAEERVLGAPAWSCGCERALEHAIMTAPARVARAQRERYALLTGRYLPPGAADP